MRENWKIAAVVTGLVDIGAVVGTLSARAQSGSPPGPSKSSYLPLIEENFRR